MPINVGTGANAPFTVQGTAGADRVYVATSPSAAGPRAVVLDLDTNRVLFNQPLEDVQRRGLVFPGSPGDDTYEIGSDVNFPLGVFDVDGDNAVLNSAGDKASGIVTGSTNNIPRNQMRTPGVEGRVPGARALTPERRAALERQISDGLQGGEAVMDRLRAGRRIGRTALEREGHREPTLEERTRRLVTPD